MKNKTRLKDDDIKTLKSARRILRRLTVKNRKWQAKLFSVGLSSADYDKLSREYDEWLDSLYDKASVDFHDKAFIELGFFR